MSPKVISKILSLRLEKRRIRLQEEFHQWIGGSILDFQLGEAALRWEARAVTADARLIETPGLKILANR